MEKIENVKEFVEKIDAGKKLNPKDLSSDQDLTIAIMNLISIEEHLVFSGAKTGKKTFYDLVQNIREMRKNYLQKVIPAYEGEVWCISKHLLAAAMRLMEVGTKQQSLNHREEAYKLFDRAYELYCLFWGLNMNLLNAGEVNPVENKLQPLAPKPGAEIAKIAGGKDTVQTAVPEDAGKMSKIKNFVRKAVDCCIE